MLAEFPAGVYRFSGQGTDGAVLEGSAELSHAMPAAAVLLYPPDGAARVRRQGLVLRWKVGKGLAGVVVVLGQEGTGRELRVALAGDATALRVPDGFCGRGRATR